MIVVDASVLVAALVDNTDHAKWSSEIIEDGELHSTAMVSAEVLNTLRRMDRLDEITELEAQLALIDLPQLGLNLHPFAPYTGRIWELRHNLSSYDAWYVALAESLGCPLVTLDFRSSRAGGVRCEVLTPPS